MLWTDEVREDLFLVVSPQNGPVWGLKESDFPMEVFPRHGCFRQRSLGHGCSYTDPCPVTEVYEFAILNKECFSLK